MVLDAKIGEALLDPIKKIFGGRIEGIPKVGGSSNDFLVAFVLGVQDAQRINLEPSLAILT